MKRIISIALLLVSTYTAYSQGIISENKELPRATFMSYRSDVARSTRDKKYSENFIELSGEWQYKDPLSTKTASIILPSNNEMNALGQAIYSQQAYPFLTEKPVGTFDAPSNTQTISYTRNFSIPFDYLDKIVYLHIGAANSSVKVFVNGQYVGFSTDSKTPAEFNINQFVSRGMNSVELQVSKYCQGSYLEDQSGWRFSGINREIFLFTQPKIRIRDFIVRTSLDPTYTNGLLETALLLKSELLNTHTVTVFYDLFDPQGNLVNQASKEIETSMRSEDTVRFTATIQNVKQWNNETPNLYTVMYRVKREGRFTEYATVKAGFRTVEIAEDKLVVNGKLIKIRGVNLSEFSPVTGNVLSSAEMSEAVSKMKYAGMNAIRTDGYPLPAEFYDICDEMGMFVCDVANINAQGIGTSIFKGMTLANNPSWCDDFLYRVNNMYERNKSHASVIMWSLGDNAGNGYNMYEAYLMLKKKDTTRPIIYNGGGMEFNTDIYCPDALPGPNPARGQRVPSRVVANLPAMPVIFSRTAFDPQIWQSEKYVGGFINRWTSPSITVGGKFAELSNEYKLTQKSNGTIDVSSAQDNLDEITALFQGVKVRIVDAKKRICEFENNLDFANLNELNINYQILKDGIVKREYVIHVNAMPGEKVQVTMPSKFKGMFTGKANVVINVGNLAKFNFNK